MSAQQSLAVLIVPNSTIAEANATDQVPRTPVLFGEIVQRPHDSGLERHGGVVDRIGRVVPVQGSMFVSNDTISLLSSTVRPDWNLPDSSEEFTKQLERFTGRKVAPGKPGPKPNGGAKQVNCHRVTVGTWPPLEAPPSHAHGV